MEDYATDAKAWVQTIRAKTGAPCVWLLGHSEGGTIALEAAQSATDICGLVLVSAVDASQTVLARAKFEQQQKASAQVLVQNQATGINELAVHGS